MGPSRIPRRVSLTLCIPASSCLEHPAFLPPCAPCWDTCSPCFYFCRFSSSDHLYRLLGTSYVRDPLYSPTLPPGRPLPTSLSASADNRNLYTPLAPFISASLPLDKKNCPNSLLYPCSPLKKGNRKNELVLPLPLLRLHGAKSTTCISCSPAWTPTFLPAEATRVLGGASWNASQGAGRCCRGWRCWFRARDACSVNSE